MTSIWPALVYIALSVLGFGFVVAKHGQPRDAYNTLNHMIAMAVSWSLLYWGGFFDSILR